MKRTAHVLIGAIFLTMLLIPACFAQGDSSSLVDAARATRKDKSQAAPTKVFDNDTLPREEHISVVGQAAATPTSLKSENVEASPTQETAANDKDADAKKDEKTKLTIDPDTSAGDREKIYGEWRKKVADQKDTITLLQRELDVLQREYRLRAAAMYADVGNRLRNQGDWDKQDRDYKDKIEAKQKDLDRARQQLSDLQAQARKGGVPAGVVE
jgi:hypothetical protein